MTAAPSPFDQPTIYIPNDSLLPAEMKRRKRRRVLLAAAGAVALGLLFGGGIAVGQATAPTRPECVSALGFAEQGLNDSAQAMQVLSDGLSGGLYGLAGVSGKLSPITADIKTITPQYKAAKAACEK